jgi:hypothetical protein
MFKKSCPRFKEGDVVITNANVYPDFHVGRILTIERVIEYTKEITYQVVEEGETGFKYYDYELDLLPQYDTKLGQLW